MEQLRDALAAAGQSQAPSEVLSAWRTRVLPLDPVEKAAHQTILRAFAATGLPPVDADLDPVTAGTSRSTRGVLQALHDADAIRLDSDGQIALAYPFSWLGKMAVDPLQQRSDDREPVPAESDHPLTCCPYQPSQPRGRRGSQFVCTLSGPLLQEADTPQADAHLRVRPQPHKITFLELATATPAHRRRRTRGLVCNGHTSIICPGSGVRLEARPDS